MAMLTDYEGFVPAVDECDIWMMGGPEFFDSVDGAVRAGEEPLLEAQGPCALRQEVLAEVDSVKAMYTEPEIEDVAPADAIFVGDRLTRRYYRLGVGCRQARSIVPRRRVYFRSLATATQAGYKAPVIEMCR